MFREQNVYSTAHQNLHFTNTCIFAQYVGIYTT